MNKSEDDRTKSEGDIDFRELLENLPMGIYQTDNEGRLVYCNKTLAQILGYLDKNDLIGKKIKDFYRFPEDRDRLLKKMTKEGGKFLDEILHWKTRLNKDIYLSDSCQLIIDADGNETGVRGMLSEIWYRKVFDEMNEGIYKVGPDLETIVKVNQTVAKMFGYTYPEEIEGEKFSRFYKYSSDVEKFINTLHSQGKVENYPIEMVKKNGEEFVVSVNASLLKDETGKFIGREGTLRDITEDYKIREILEDMPTGAYQVKNKNGINRISYCNKAFAEMFGYSIEEVPGMEAKKFHADESVLEQFERALREADAKGESLLDYKLHVKKKTKERFWAEIDSHLLKDHKGNIIGRQGTLRDATIKLQLQEMLDRKQDIQRFSHRFMAPVMSIKSSSDTLFEEVKQSIEWKLSGDIREILKKIHGDPFTLLKEIKHLSKKLLKLLEDFLVSKEEVKNYISQLKRYARQLRDFTDVERIDDLIELRETHRNIRICLLEYQRIIPDNPYIREKAGNILNHIEVLDKLYILYIVQTITNTSKIAYTEVENLRSYLLGWETKRRDEPYHYRKENLYECLKEVINIYRIYAFEKGISIEVSAAPFIEIEMSMEDLKRMLHNLIQNAVKYSYKRKGNIRIRVENMVKDVKIGISNYGVGILPEEIESGRVFEIGYRGQLAFDWNRTGSGIGLAEAKKIAEKHGGDITISSTPAGEKKEDPKTPYVTKVVVRLPKFHDERREK